MGDYMNPKTIKSQRWQIVNADFVGISSTLVYPSLLTSYAIRSEFPGRFDLGAEGPMITGYHGHV